MPWTSVSGGYAKKTKAGDKGFIRDPGQYEALRRRHIPKSYAAAIANSPHQIHRKSPLDKSAFGVDHAIAKDLDGHSLASQAAYDSRQRSKKQHHAAVGVLAAGGTAGTAQGIGQLAGTNAGQAIRRGGARALGASVRHSAKLGAASMGLGALGFGLEGASILNERRANRQLSPVRKDYTPGAITYHHEQAQLHARKKASAKRQLKTGGSAAGTGLTLALAAPEIKSRVTGLMAPKVAADVDAARRATRVGNVAGKLAEHGGYGALIGGAGLTGVGAARTLYHGARQNAETKAAQAARRQRRATMTKAAYDRSRIDPKTGKPWTVAEDWAWMKTHGVKHGSAQDKRIDEARGLRTRTGQMIYNKTTAPHGRPIAKAERRWTLRRDQAWDQAHGVKEGSREDERLDRSRGLKEHQTSRSVVIRALPGPRDSFPFHREHDQDERGRRMISGARTIYRQSRGSDQQDRSGFHAHAYPAGGAPGGGRSNGMRKAFDPERQRERRNALYEGAAAGGSVAAGEAARRMYQGARKMQGQASEKAAEARMKREDVAQHLHQTGQESGKHPDYLRSVARASSTRLRESQKLGGEAHKLAVGARSLRRGAGGAAAGAVGLAGTAYGIHHHQRRYPANAWS